MSGESNRRADAAGAVTASAVNVPAFKEAVESVSVVPRMRAVLEMAPEEIELVVDKWPL